MDIINKKNICIFIIYFIITLICIFYFFNRATSYENINSTKTFIAYPLTLLLALCFLIYHLILTDRKKYIFQLTISFAVLLGAVVLLFELVKPNYTYVDAQKFIKEKYYVEITDNEEKVFLNGGTNGEIYKITAYENSQAVTFSFNPYTKEIFKIEE